MRSSGIVVAALAAAFGVFSAAAAHAIDCSVTSTGLRPLTDLVAGRYLGLYEGGLYPGRQNEIPVAHLAAGLERAARVAPLLRSGAPSTAGGKIVLLSIGMSNTTQEFCGASETTDPCLAGSFVDQASSDARVRRNALVLVDGAKSSQVASDWRSPDAPNYDRIRQEVLRPQGLREAQVQVAWVKVAQRQPTLSLPDADADAVVLEEAMGDIARALRARYPNLQLAFFSSRIYAGYADTNLNPEPFAYESGFAVKWLVQAQIEQMENAGEVVDPQAGDLAYDEAAPWIGWGPYLWADGVRPRSDGLAWACADFADDGTHPGPVAREKVGEALLDFFLDSPVTSMWFRKRRACGLLGIEPLLLAGLVLWRRGRLRSSTRPPDAGPL